MKKIEIEKTLAFVGCFCNNRQFTFLYKGKSYIFIGIQKNEKVDKNIYIYYNIEKDCYKIIDKAAAEKMEITIMD